MPINKDNRPPYISLVSISRPNSSVPSKLPGLPMGNKRLSILALNGSAGASNGANTADITRANKTTALIIAKGSDLSWRSTNRQYPMLCEVLVMSFIKINVQARPILGSIKGWTISTIKFSTTKIMHKTSNVP